MSLPMDDAAISQLLAGILGGAPQLTPPPQTGDPMLDQMLAQAMLGGGQPPQIIPPPGPPPLPPMPPPSAGPIQANPLGMLEPPVIPTPRTELVKSRVKDYELRKADGGNRPAKPKVEWILEEKTRRQGVWQTRDTRMDDDLRLYNLSDAMETPDPETGDEKIVKGTPKAMVNKLSYMVGRQNDKIETKPRANGPEWIAAAQTVEDFLYTLREEANMKHMSRLRMSLGRDEAWFAAVRGWISSRIYLEPDKEFPICIELHDSRYCYPQMGMSGPGMVMNMIYCESTTVGNFIANNPWAKDNPYIESLKSDDTVDHIWYEDEWYSIILIDDIVVRSVTHNYGFCPWVVSVCGGSAVDTDEFRHHIGEGMLTPLRHTMKQIDRFLSKLMAGVSRYGNPAYLKKYNSDLQGSPPSDLDMSPGTPNEVDEGKGQGYDLLNTMAPPMETQLIWEALNDDLAKLGLIGQLWGTPEGLSSGFHQAVAINAAEDALFPVTDAIIQHRQWQNRLALNLVLVADDAKLLEADLTDSSEGEAKMGIGYEKRKRGQSYVKDEAGRITKSRPSTIGVLTPDDVRKHGTKNKVRLRRMTPQDTFMAIQAGAMAVRENLFDLDYVRGEMLDVDDPEAMNIAVMQDFLFKDEEAMREIFMPMALMGEPALYEWYMKRMERKRQDEARNAMMGAGEAGGAPGGGIPPNIPGAPTGIMPSQMQADQTMPQPAGMPFLGPEMVNQNIPY
jgi:hypothetical protein